MRREKKGEFYSTSLAADDEKIITMNLLMYVGCVQSVMFVISVVDL